MYKRGKKKKTEKNVLLVRLELTASAYHSTVYKYGALTDCATGAARQIAINLYTIFVISNRCAILISEKLTIR